MANEKMTNIGLLIAGLVVLAVILVTYGIVQLIDTKIGITAPRPTAPRLTALQAPRGRFRNV